MMRTQALPISEGMMTSAGPCPLADGFHVLARCDARLASLLDDWEALARRASTPNPFYEHWYLLPSLAAFDPSGDVRLGVYVAGGKLCGLVPIARSDSYHGRHLPHLAAWVHPNIFSSNPLVAAGMERAFWSALLGWLDAEAGSAWFFHLRLVSAGDPLITAFAELCGSEGRAMRKVLAGQRAELRSKLAPEAYLAQAMTTKARKELRRQRKRLGDLGEIAWHRSRDAQGLEAWVADFLALERKGWKGTAGSALADDARTAGLFRSALAGAAQVGQLERLSLTMDGRPIAMLATFLAPPGAFAYKTAFDEEFARFSPGMQLQVENLALLEDESIAWCDSCAEPGHSMIERIWTERRPFAFFTVPIGGGLRRKAGEAWAWLEERRQEARS